ncbi:hypothetical protein E3N88_14262 [Mikania micrantha]|uniref:Arabidopsis retrotransposon Orf1 C-terminal domain-containing protein n=1 Tax=Mikania micrantha TaxID=192012 RepID=A0A5N6P198_9ASTR|nr:hypothetical protein E3N88_14262 [Mikania micrantha]
MSGAAESSAVGAKRARGSSSSRRRAREIHYSSPEILPIDEDEPVPIDDRVLRDHTVLQFEQGTEEATRCDRFVTMEHYHHRIFDRELLERLGRLEEFDAVVRDEWRTALDCRWPQYMELTVEFHSTFRQMSGSFDDPAAVSFALGRRTFSMSIPQFAIATGFYTDEQVRAPEFAQSLRAVVREPSDLGITERQLEEFWSSIADGPFTSAIIESSIRDPLIRYVHRMVSCTLIGRRAGVEKCNQLDLLCMYSMISRRPANLACILLSSFARIRRGGATARLDLGPYIGRIALRLGVFNRFPRRFLTEGPETGRYSLDDMRLAGMCSMADPATWMPARPAPERTPDVEVLQRQVPPERQRILHRAERPPQTFPLRQPRPPRITLESLWEEQQRLGQMMRLLFAHFEIEIPEWFRAPDQPQHPGGHDDEPHD